MPRVVTEVWVCERIAWENGDMVAYVALLSVITDQGHESYEL
jgi:hypothetical protein